jgi:hypothetical protein
VDGGSCSASNSGLSRTSLSRPCILLAPPFPAVPGIGRPSLGGDVAAAHWHLLTKINLNIVNDVTYKHATFYYKILYIVGYKKITKSDKIYRLKI